MRVIGDFLRRVSTIYPEKVAVVDYFGKYSTYGASYTWSHFNALVNKLANSFLTIGLKRGDKLGVYSDTRSQYFTIYQAVAKIGVTLVPLNTAYKGDELTYLINDSAVKALVVDADRIEAIESIKTQLEHTKYFIGIGKDHPYPYDYDKLIEDGISNEPIVKVEEEDLAMLLYTSGTTGRPKGAMMTHRNWVTSALICTQEWRLYPRHKFLCVLAPFFTGALAFMTFSVARGYTIVMSEFNPEKVLQIIQDDKISYSMFVPTMTSRLVKFPDVKKYNLSSIEHVVTSGAPISEALVREASEVLFNGNLKFVFTYGTTETAVTGCQLQPEEVSLEGPTSKRLTSVGKAMIGMEVKVIDDEGNEIKAGSDQPGEVVVIGDSVGKGYWNKPENEELKDGVWYSGDLARVDEDGYIYIVDRKKDMILSGGANIYPREVEDVLHAHPAVLHAVVIGVPDPEWGERVHAVIVLKEGAKATEEEMISFVKARLASYKCPKSVEFLKLDELPLSPVGKILKRELRERYWKGYERKGVV
ncbi:MAG: AMP-dependent synthetase [Deltaproteobacteria bacterium]|nr:MAG: AMP-dependent synthetase [Deltaproteobacteria bacterium]